MTTDPAETNARGGPAAPALADLASRLRGFEGRATCPRCMRPEVVCYCAHVTAFETRVRVLFLQHPRERDVPINTARIARLCLPNSELRVGVDFARDPVVVAALADPARQAVLLFPEEEDATPGAADAPGRPSTPDVSRLPPERLTLVVVDGTWWQAEKIVKTNPALRALPRRALAPSSPSRYRIRREPEAHCVSTIEALAEILGAIEGDPEGARRLLAPFDAMVEAQLAYAQSQERRARHARRPRALPEGTRDSDRRRARRLPRVVHERAHDLVVAFGETNAWSFAERTRAPEVLYWVAERVLTGERFSAVLAPRQALAPSFPHYARLAEERVTAGESFASFADRWRAFAGERAVVGYWGHHAVDALEAEGLAVPDRVDMRDSAIRYLGRKPGTIDACVEALGAAPAHAWAEGRAGERLASLAAIARRIVAPIVRDAGDRAAESAED